jgi:4-amino-4-deoxy-L-arabinose transferase-like glycosyltransferase
MPDRRPLLIVLTAGSLALAIGTARAPLWDEDEPRFAAIARTMVETGDWIVPVFNDTLAVDKPVLMHWAMAACMQVFGVNEFAARLPSMIAALITALALLRVGTRFFSSTVGVVAALAWLGSLLVGIEAHAATPDAILVALCTWATVLAAEVIAGSAPQRAADSLGTLKKGDIPLSAAPPSDTGPEFTPGGPVLQTRGMSPFCQPCIACGDDALPQLGVGRALAIGLLLGLAVVCKGPIGFVGPLAVLVPWAWWVAVDRRRAEMMTGSWLQQVSQAALPGVIDVIRSLRPLTLTLGVLMAAAPWYAAVWARTDGAWIEGFFFVHNVGRFMAPMEKHSGGVLFHPLTMLVLFYPWSCFLPFAVGVASWRVWQRSGPLAARHALGLVLAWLLVWVGGFSAAATKLPNYILPAYPAAALLVAALGVEAVRQATTCGRWPHPRWLAAGLGSLAFGGIATAATIVVISRYGLPGAEPAAVVGAIPVVAAIACWQLARTRPQTALACFTGGALLYTALAVGPAAGWMATANTLPEFVSRLRMRDEGQARLGTFMMSSPNVVFYAAGHVNQICHDDLEAAERFLTSDPSAVLLVPADRLERVTAVMPADFGEIGRTQPMFRRQALVALGRLMPSDRTASLEEVTR